MKEKHEKDDRKNVEKTRRKKIKIKYEKVFNKTTYERLETDGGAGRPVGDAYTALGQSTGASSSTAAAPTPPSPTPRLPLPASVSSLSSPGDGIAAAVGAVVVGGVVGAVGAVGATAMVVRGVVDR